MPIRIGYNLPQKWFASIGTRQPLDHRNVNNEIFATENKLIIKLLFSLTILLRNNELYHWFCFFDTSISLLYLLFSSQTNKFIPPMATLNVTAKSEELVDTFQDQMFYLISVTTTISKMETETAHICKRRPCRYRAQSWGTNHLSDSATRHKAYSWLKESYNPSPSRVYCSVRIHLSLHAIQFTPSAGHNGRAKSRNLI